jgi:hypothetical protein
MSDFHPEQWNPSWSVASILTGLLSFMLEATSTTGSVTTTDEEKRFLAKQSRRWNREQNHKFIEIFADLAAQPIDLPSVSTGSNAGADEKATKSPPILSPKLKQPKDILDRNVAGDEVKFFLEAGGVRMLLIGLLIYIVFQFAMSLLGGS